MSTNKPENELAYTTVKETSHGIREISDFIHLFAHQVKIPSESIGSARLLTRKEISQEYPTYGSYMDSLRRFASYLKATAMDHSPDAYSMRAHNIAAVVRLLDVTSRLQFFKAFEEYVDLYTSDNVGWGMLSLHATFSNNQLVQTDVYLGDTKLDLSKPIHVQLIDWDGELVEFYNLVDLNQKYRTEPEYVRDENDALQIDSTTGKPKLKNKVYPVNLGLVVSDDSVANQALHEEAERKFGALNKSDIRKSMTRSILDFPLMRIVNPEEDEELTITSYQTPVFTQMDYCHDIEFNDVLAVMVKFNELKEKGYFNNLREFSLLNLFRWGVLSLEAWDRGKQIFDAVMNAPKLDEYNTIIDRKMVTWGTACIADLQKRNPQQSKDITDNIVISGSALSKMASMFGQGYLIVRSLIVTDVEPDDVGFREARLALRSKRERTNRFQSITRLNADEYKIVELDKDDNIIGVVNAIDVMAIINYDAEVVVISFEDSDQLDDQKKKDLYHAIYEYKPTSVEMKKA